MSQSEHVFKVGPIKYTDIYQLAKVMYLFNDFFAEELRKEELLKFIRDEDENKYKRIISLSSLPLPDDVFVFRASYILNPYMNFRIKGFSFYDYKDLGKTMLAYSPSFNSTLLNVVRFSLLSYQMHVSLYDREHEEVIREVIKIENEVKNDISYAYFLLGYYLSGSTSIIYKGYEYKNLYSLMYFLCKREKNLQLLGNYLSTSPLLKAYSKFSKDSDEVSTYLHLCEENDKSEKKLIEFLTSKEALKK